MKCTNKKKLFYIGINNKTGKKKTLLTSILVDKILVNKFDGSILTCKYDSSLPSDLFNYFIYTDFDVIPCGQCIACKLNKSMEMANRGVLESLYHNSAYFITLTYDDEHLNYKEYVDCDGVVCSHPTLELNEFQKFKKRLRKRFNNHLTFLDCGEYGKKTLRPHYHFICWDLVLDDLKLFKFDSKHNYYIYTSDFISSLWGKGFITVAEVNFNTIAYVCRYNLKKSNNDLSSFYDLTGVEKEFRHFPSRPALGYQYFIDNYQDIYKNDEIINSGFKYKTIKPPKYFDYLLEKVDLDLYNSVKQKRRSNTDYDDYTDLDYSDYYQFIEFQNALDDINFSKVSHLKSNNF